MTKISLRRRCHQGRTFAITCSLISIIQISTAEAMEASDWLVFSKGRFSARPHVGVFTEYNDNIFYRPAPAEADISVGISPGMRLLIGEDLPNVNRVSFDYTLDQTVFFDHNELNAMQHHLALDGRYGTTKTTIAGSVRRDFLSSTLGGLIAATGIKVDRFVAQDDIRAEYFLGDRTGIYAEGSHYSGDYQQSIGLFDSRTLRGTGGFQWRLSTETLVFGEVYYGDTVFNSNTGAADPPGKTAIGGFVGARGKFTEKLSGLVKAGYELTEFERAGFGAASAAESAPVVAMGLTYQITERASIGLNYSRQQQASVEFSRSAYVSDDISLTGSAQLGSTGRLRWVTSGRIAFHEYEPSFAFASRNDVDIHLSTSLNWYFQTWIWTQVRFDHSRRESDLPFVIEYAQNRVTLSLNIGY